MAIKEHIAEFNKQTELEGWQTDVDLGLKSPIFKTGVQYLDIGQDLLLAMFCNDCK